MASESATTSSSALGARFGECRREGRAALIAYITAGHPDPEQSVDVIAAVGESADVIEIGVPFSDPMADGPVIQASSQRALEHGVTFDRVLDIVARAAPRVPLVLFSYLNPVIAAGRDALQRAADAGFSGILVTDLPLGADAEREAWIGEGPLDFVRLVAPTTPTERMAEIARHGRGFVYLISRTGVTGMRDALPDDLPATVDRLRSVCTLPVAVGFGIARPEQAAQVARIADGVVVGSALVHAAETGGAGHAGALARALRGALSGA